MSALASHLTGTHRLVTPLATLVSSFAVLFVVAFDQGQLAGALQAAAGNTTVHEFFHDSRHMLGVPCH